MKAIYENHIIVLTTDFHENNMKINDTFSKFKVIHENRPLSYGIFE